MDAVEERTRAAMAVLAEQAEPVDLLARLDQAAARRPRSPQTRRWVVAAAVVAVVLVLVLLGVNGWLQAPSPDVIEPVVHPPKVVRLADGANASPGRAVMEVTFAPSGGHDAETFVVPAGRDEAIRVPMSRHVSLSYSRHLSYDGTRLVLQQDSAATPRLEVLDLRTGSRQDVGGKLGYCPRLSPDNRTVAAWDATVEHVALAFFDVATGEPREVGRSKRPITTDENACTEVAWSPDGSMLAAPLGRDTVVTSSSGEAIARFRDSYAVNGGQSWSPDGTRILLYNRLEGRYVVRYVRGRHETSLGDTMIGKAPLGWAGSRVVWLAGGMGDQRLVTTDDEGADERLWIRFDVGDRTVHTVSWSSTLAGATA